MSWRTIIISSQAKLDYQMGLMVVRGEETKKVAVDEIAVLVVENPAVSFTGCLLEELVKKKVRVLFCDSKRNPVAELTPHHGSHDSTAKIRIQVSWSEKVKAEMWREIISEKIRKQAEFLMERGKKKEAALLKTYIKQVELADMSNREGHAAKVYFNALFGMDFTRSEESPINAALNYGYSLILSCINREVAASGYLTQLGIFHDNMFNHYNLSCDLMEPFRVLVDRFVVRMVPKQFEKAEKHELWKLLGERITIDSHSQSLLNAIKIYVHSFFEAMNDGDPGKIKFYSNNNNTQDFKIPL